jgi:hypothetical protein
MFKKIFNKKRKDKTPVEKYMAHWDRVFNKEPEYYQNESNTSALPGVTSIIYRDVPEKGMTTALTYGLSLVEHSDWKMGRPELIITVNSTDINWGQAIGFMANKLRGDCPFSYSNRINFGIPISKDSDLNAFLVFAPSIFINKEEYLNIDIGLDYTISIAGMYPIYAEEMDFINARGLEYFLKQPGLDLYDVQRKRIQ